MNEYEIQDTTTGQWYIKTATGPTSAIKELVQSIYSDKTIRKLSRNEDSNGRVFSVSLKDGQTDKYKLYCGRFAPTYRFVLEPNFV